MSRYTTTDHHILAATLTLITYTLLATPSVDAQTEEEQQLLRAVTRGSEGARVQAATRLYHLDLAKQAVPRLEVQLRGDDPDERCLAARLLGLLRSSDAVPALTQTLSDDDWALRRDSAEALGQIGATGAARSLALRLDDPHQRVRIAVVRALAELQAFSEIRESFDSEADAEVRLHLIEALARDRSSAGTSLLRRTLEETRESHRLLAACLLLERGDATGIDQLAARLTSSSATARFEAVDSLRRATGGAIGPARRLLFSTFTLSGDDAELTLSAAAALAHFGDPRGVTRIRTIARGNFPAATRARALTLLEELESQ